MSKYEKTLERILEIAKGLSEDESSGDLPDSTLNADSAVDSIDAHTLQNGMGENLREGHITGTGGPIVKRALTEEQLLEKAKADEISRYSRSGMDMIMPYAAPVAAANKAVLSNPFTASLGYGLAGAGLAKGVIGVKNWLSGEGRPTEEDKRRQRNQTIVAGLLSGVAGLTLMKKGSFMGADPLTLIQSKILSDNTLTSVQQQVMINTVSGMSQTKQFGLAQILLGLVGAGIGAAAARYISNMGLVGTVGGGLLGAFIGSRIGTQPTPSAGGVNNSVDFFGRPF